MNGESATILVINPGSTSTRMALFEGDAPVADRELVCAPGQLAACTRVVDQFGFRTEQIRNFLQEINRPIADCDAVAARGGPLRPTPGGVYRINDAMLADVRSDGLTEHVSMLACVIADQLCRPAGVPCFVVDPVTTDELDDIARISGLKELPRRALSHALNMKRTARLYAAQIGRPYESLNLITAHIGGGASLAVHRGGRMVDSVDANGEGPFSPERSGGLRVDSLAKLACGSGKDYGAFRALLTRQGGLMSHLGTTDAQAIESRIRAGDRQAELVYSALAYATAKHICALAAAVSGRVDGIILTGGLARSSMVTGWITDRVKFLAPVTVYPGQDEMAALREGVARALAGEEPIRVYPTGESEKTPSEKHLC